MHIYVNDLRIRPETTFPIQLSHARQQVAPTLDYRTMPSWRELTVKRTMQPRSVFVSLFLALSYPQSIWSQHLPEATVVTKTSRPLVELAQSLVLKEGLLVDYEDPAYLFVGDLIDVTATQTSAVFRAANPTRIIFGVRANPVTFTLPTPDSISNPVGLIASLLATNEQAGNPGIFKVVSSGRRLQIVPYRAKDALGIDSTV